MEQKDLCLKCKTGYMKPTEDNPRKVICNFCGRTELTWTLKDIEELKRTGRL